MSNLINILILLLSFILVQASQQSVSQCLPQNSFGCLDKFGYCASSNYSCADYCTSNNDCHLTCCYQNYCIIGNKCFDNNNPSSSTGIFLAIFFSVFFGTFFLIIIIICCVRRSIIRRRNRGLQGQTNQAAINNQFQMNNEMMRQNAQMQQMYFNQQPQQMGFAQPYNYNNNFQAAPVFDNQIPQMQPYNLNQMYYPQQYMQPQQQFQPLMVTPSQQVQPQQAYTQPPPESKNKQQLVTYI